jgi:hypothetical protein
MKGCIMKKLTCLEKIKLHVMKHRKYIKKSKDTFGKLSRKCPKKKRVWDEIWGGYETQCLINETARNGFYFKCELSQCPLYIKELKDGKIK